MVFVTLGSQDKQFLRLVKEVDKLVKEKVITDEVIVQAGVTKLDTNRIKILDYIDVSDFQKYMNESDYIIAHGGVGSILDAMKLGKKIIAVPREAKYDEIANDHQKQIIAEFAKKRYIIGCKDVKDLRNAILKVKSFKPNKYVSNNDNFVAMVDNFIQNNI
ncbi:MAG: hypothetical protein IJO63_00875 [Bacilli bacterium]|nr:hypothetical protein [Bacilli bacterium]